MYLYSCQKNVVDQSSARACVRRLAKCDELKSASSVRAPLDRVRCEKKKKTMCRSSPAPSSLWSKSSKRCSSKTPYISKQCSQHREQCRILDRPYAEDVLCKKASHPWEGWQILPLASPWTRTRWLAERGRLEWQKRIGMSISKLKQQAAGGENDAWSILLYTLQYSIRSRQKSLPCCSVDRVDLWCSVVDLHVCLKTQKPSVRQYILCPTWCTRDRRAGMSFSRSRSTTQLATHGAAPKSIRREVEKEFLGRRFKTRSTGLVEAETFFSLALWVFISRLWKFVILQ